MPDYRALHQDGKQRALAFIEDRDGWKESPKSTENTIIESKPSDKHNCSVYRLTIWVNSTFDNAFDTYALHFGSKRGEWDQNVQEMKLLEQIDENLNLQLLHTNPIAMGIISPREFVEVALLERTDDEIIYSGKSVEYPPLSSNGKYVRGFNGCWLLKIDRDHKRSGLTRIVNVSEVDMKGRLPRAVVDRAVSTVLPTAIHDWRNYLEKNSLLY